MSRLMIRKGKCVRSALSWPPPIPWQRSAASHVVEEEVRNQNGKVFVLKKQNDKLEKYYKAQKICRDENEWDRFMAFARQGLPQSFRLNEAKVHQSKRLRNILSSGRFDKGDVSVRQVDAQGWMWQANVSRWDLLGRRSEELEQFHKFLYLQEGISNISRQELVSQVPVRCLDVQPHHAVLDMCASPGSKTKQVVECLHKGQGVAIPPGVVVANEFNAQRGYRLVNQVKKLSSPNILCVNHDGGSFPDIFLTSSKDQKSALEYDRIVCDQPCSGDGTIRKNPNNWLNWSPAAGNLLHLTQYDIARRGLELLKVGGIFAYSSCAMNPIENEAVLNALLAESEGAFEILDISEKLQKMGMVSAPGLTDWMVFDRDMNPYEDVNKFGKELLVKKGFWPSMFPTSNEFTHQLSRAMRFLPHFNNDGGFFVAILRKNREMPWQKKPGLRSWKRCRDFKSVVIREFNAPNKKLKKAQNLWRPRCDMSFDMIKDDIQKDLDFLGIQSLDTSLFFSSGKATSVSLASGTVKNIIETNPTRSLNIFAGGTKCLRKSDRKTSSTKHQLYPHLGEALLLPLMNECRQIFLSKSEAKELFHSPPLKGVPLEGVFEGTKLEQIRKLARFPGPVKLTLDFDVEHSFLGHLGCHTLLLDTPSDQRSHVISTAII